MVLLLRSSWQGHFRELERTESATCRKERRKKSQQARKTRQKKVSSKGGEKTTRKIEEKQTERELGTAT